MSVDLNGLTLFFNPRGYKSGVLYNTLPYNNIGNFTYARTGPASRKNSSGITNMLAENVPQLDSLQAGCPSLLCEPERPNLFLNSSEGITQNIILSSNAYTLSFEGTGTVNITGGHSLTGTGINDRVSLTFPARAGFYTFTISGDVKNVNVERGDFDTNWIPTTGVIATRGLPMINLTSDVFNDNEGVLIINTSALFDSLNHRTISIWSGSASNMILFRYNNTSNVLSFRLFSGGDLEVDALISVDDETQLASIGIRYSSLNYSIWMNGERVFNQDNITTPSGLNEIRFAEGSINRYEGRLEMLSYYNIFKSDEEMANLTRI